MEQHAWIWEESPNNVKWRGKQGANRQVCVWYWCDFFINMYEKYPYSYSGFLWARCSPWHIEKGPRASLDRWRQPLTSLGMSVGLYRVSIKYSYYILISSWVYLSCCLAFPTTMKVYTYIHVFMLHYKPIYCLRSGHLSCCFPIW